MEISAKKLTKNVLSLSTGQILSILLNFAAIALAARALGPSDFGIFSNILAIVAIVSKFADIGFAPIVFRELSKKENDYSLLNTALTIRLFLFVISLIGLNIFLMFSNNSSVEILVANILMLTIIISAKMANIRELLSTPFKVKLKMHYPMVLLGIDNLFLLIGIYLLIISKISIFTFTLIYVFSNLPGFILQMLFLFKKFNYKFKFDNKNWNWLFKQSIPIGGLVILMSIFQQIDLIILNYVNSAYDAGIYSIALRLSMPLNIIPSSIVTTVFPIIVSKLNDNLETTSINKFIFKLLFLISFLIAVVFSFKSTEYISFIFGKDYILSSFSSNLLLISQIFLFFNFFALDLLTAHNKQNYNFLYSSVLVFFNVSFAIFLIPAYDHNGAAIAKILTSVIGFIFLVFIMMKSKIGFNFFNVRVVIWGISIIIILYFISEFNIFFYTIIVFPIVIVLTILIKFFSDNEINLIKRIIGIKSANNE